jgi:hypothetical protein
MGFLLSVKIMGYPSSFPARGVDNYAKGMCKDLEYDIGTDFGYHLNSHSRRRSRVNSISLRLADQ